MAQVKLTVMRGKPHIKDIALSAGTPIAGSDAMELNADFTKMAKGDAMTMIDELRAKLFASPWPLV